MRPPLAGNRLDRKLNPAEFANDPGPDVQVNVRLSKPLKNAFFAVCDRQNVSATEAITRLMHAFIEDAATRIPHHTDGSICPLARFVQDLTHAIVSPYFPSEKPTTHERKKK